MAEWNKKSKVTQHYNSLAPVYDAQYSEEQERKIRTALGRTNLKKHSLVLDAGCGTGLLFKHVGKSTKLLVGLDMAPRILKEAKKRVRQLPTTSVICADADFTPFRDTVFDAAFAITLLQNMPDPLATLCEMKRVTKNNAFLVITGLKKQFSQEAFEKLLERAGLRSSMMESGDELKGYVAVCWKGRQHLKERYRLYRMRTEDANAR